MLIEQIRECEPIPTPLSLPCRLPESDQSLFQIIRVAKHGTGSAPPTGAVGTAYPGRRIERAGIGPVRPLQALSASELPAARAGRSIDF
jgi:hypothetical protein